MPGFTVQTNVTIAGDDTPGAEAAVLGLQAQFLGLAVSVDKEFGESQPVLPHVVDSTVVFLLQEARDNAGNYVKSVVVANDCVAITLTNRHVSESLEGYSFSGTLKELGYLTWGDLGKLTRTQLGELGLNLNELSMICSDLIVKGLWKDYTTPDT